MSSYDILQNSFPSGELSPLWKGRSNSQFYQTGLELCRNFMPLSPNGLRRRPGTRYVMQTYQSRDALLIQVSDSERNYEYELTRGHVRFWDTENPTTIIAQTDAACLNYTDIHSVRYAVNKGSIWLAHIDYPVVRIDTHFNGSTATVSAEIVTFTGDETFNEPGKYPSAVGFTGGRLALGFPRNIPNAIFLSRTPDYSLDNPDRYTDFTYGIDPSDAIELEDSELIGGNWFLNQIRFLVGSKRSIFMDNGNIITPETFDISPGLREGSLNVQAKGMKNHIVFAGISGKTLTMMVYDRDSEGYQSKDLTADSSHLFSPGIKDFTILFMPTPIVWVLLKDNTLLSCTIDTSSGTLLTGWAKHPMQGRTIESIASGQKDDGNDILYITSSILEGATKKFHIETLEMDDIFSSDKYCYLDMAIDYKGEATDTIQYNRLLAGTKVSAMSEGMVLPEATVNSNGTVKLDREVSSCTIGIPYESLVGFLSQEQPTNGQSSFGNKRRLKRSTLRVYQSFGGYIGNQYENTDKMYKLLSSRYGAFRYGQTISLVDEDFVTDLQAQNSTSSSLYVKTDYPTPLNILALKQKIELLEV